MIFCFSGTGNSRYIARRAAEALREQVTDLNAKIKAGDHSPIQTGRDVIVITPTYAWRIPRIASDWLAQTELTGAERVWFVMNCGSEIGNASQYNRRLAERKRQRYMGTAQIVMPENYIAMFDAPHAAEAREIVQQAEPDIAGVIARLEAGQAFAAPRNTFYDRFMSGPVNLIFYKFFVNADAFTVSDACISCGQCAKRCPMNNVTLKDGKPVWGKVCTHCMACICYCPVSAIEYGKKSVGQPRYHFEAL